MAETEYKIIFTDYNSVHVLLDKNTIKESRKLHELFGFNSYKPEIRLTGIDPQIFSHILTYVKHRLINQQDGDEFAKTLISNMSFETLTNVVRTAEFLNITSLVDIASAFFKELLNKDPEIIKKMYAL